MIKWRNLSLWPLIAALYMSPSAKEIETIVIGLTSGGAPAFEESFDKRLRENLSNFPELYTADYLQTVRYRSKIRFDEFPTVSRKLVESLKQYCSDSTVFIWGAVKNYSVRPVRKNLIQGVARGEITISLTMYSLRYKDYAFCGDVAYECEEPKGFVFFGPIDESMHIPGSQRAEITDKLVNGASQKSADLIMTVIRNELAHAEKEAGAGAMDSYQIPSVQDVFSVPSVEGASVNKNRKKSFTSLPADSIKKSTTSPPEGKSGNSPQSPAAGQKK
jgi:hypothetical protein